MHYWCLGRDRNSTLDLIIVTLKEGVCWTLITPSPSIISDCYFSTFEHPLGSCDLPHCSLPWGLSSITPLISCALLQFSFCCTSFLIHSQPPLLKAQSFFAPGLSSFSVPPPIPTFSHLCLFVLVFHIFILNKSQHCSSLSACIVGYRTTHGKMLPVLHSLHCKPV